MAIEAVQIATNRNAPAGSAAINLYKTDFAENLTLGQLVGAVCLRAGAISEARSVAKMNVMGEGNELMDELAKDMEAVVRGEVDNEEWVIIRTRLNAKHGIEDLPVTVTSYINRMKALEAMKNRLDKLSQDSQENMIDLQAYVSSRDLAYNTAANVVKALQGAALRTAERFR